MGTFVSGEVESDINLARYLPIQTVASLLVLSHRCQLPRVRFNHQRGDYDFNIDKPVSFFSEQ